SVALIYTLFLLFFFMIPHTLSSTLFPYTTLFRSDNVLTHMTDGVIATDRHGNITIINETALDFLGKTEKDVIGKPITNLLGLKEDRKSTRLNSSHVSISYAVFCLKKKTDKIEYDE